MKELLIPFGVIIASIIAGIYTVLSIILAKENKISEIRQNWIDELRNDISIYTSYIEYIKLTPKTPNNDEPCENHIKAMTSFIRISLRLTANETNLSQKNLLFTLTETKNLLFRNKGNDPEDYSVITKNYVDSIQNISREILKLEWERIKKIERKSIFIIWTIIIILTLLVISLYVFFGA